VAGAVEKMKLHVDREADALYLRLDESPVTESEEVSPGIVLDFNDRHEVVGIEMLRISQRSAPIKMNSLEIESA
jgi:uncharacterized protein YuzE